MASPSPSYFLVFFRGNHDHDKYRTPPRSFEAERGYSPNAKIVQVLVLLFSVIVVLGTLLYIFTTWLLHCRTGRRATSQTLGPLAWARHSTVQPPKRGLHPSVIASLPTFIFRQPDVNIENEKTLTSSECAVCLSVLEDEEVVRLLPNCKHNFHVECIDKWLTLHSTCPVCRAEVWPAARSELTGKPAGSIPTELPPEHTGSMVALSIEGTSSDGAAMSSSHKQSESFSRLGSFKRMLCRERSPRRIQPEQDNVEDIERQQ